MTTDEQPICQECQSTDKNMSNANVRFWLCYDCKNEQLFKEFDRAMAGEK